MQDLTDVSAPDAIGRAVRRAPRVGLFSVGLGTYWAQFPGLLDELQRQHRRVAERLTEAGADVVNAGFVSYPQEAFAAGDHLRAANVDLIVVHLATYATSTLVVPAIQRAAAPALCINLQPNPSMDHPNTDTGKWLAHCGVCPMPEMSAAFHRCGIEFRSVNGHLESPDAWRKIGDWVRAAAVRATLRDARLGMLEHLYPGMMDMAQDPTLVSAHFGSHVETLEMDDLRVRVEEATDRQVDEVLERTRTIFDLADSVNQDDLRWAARVAAGMERLVHDVGVECLAYYYRGLGAEQYERLGAGLILGASLLTAQGVPSVGEFDIRTAIAMLILDRIGSGGSFTEFQAMNFDDGVVEMGHDGPAHLGIAEGRPLLRGLDVYHGKRGWGVSVEFSLKYGPATVLSLTQRKDGRFRFIVSEGEIVPGPRLQIGNTTSRVTFGCDPGEWVDAWCAAGPAHHWAMGLGHVTPVIEKIADLLDIELVKIAV